MTRRTQAEAEESYQQLIGQTVRKDFWDERMRRLCQKDLYFLLVYGLNRPDIRHPWLFERCEDLRLQPDGYLDLWAREHRKSTIITFAGSIQALLDDPEVTIGIFSHTRPTAKAFLRQIMRELEGNALLKRLFPDILYEHPTREAPLWSEDSGIVVKRKGNPKESTVEAWGVVEGQPTGRHFQLRIYDDMVSRESVTSAEMIKKTTEAWETSLNLGIEGGRERYVGTRWHHADTYQVMMDRGVVKKRIHPVVDEDGEPVLFTIHEVAKRRQAMSPYVFAAQMMLNPRPDGQFGFLEEWLRFYEEHNDGAGMNRYILVDPALGRRKEGGFAATDSSFCAMAVIGLGADSNYYLLDLVRDRLGIAERIKELFALHKRWRPLKVGYERYGMQVDIEAVVAQQERVNYRFEVVELGGIKSKDSRIERLMPSYQAGRWYWPKKLVKTQRSGEQRDLIQDLLHEEYLPWPFGRHADALDAMSRIVDEDFEVTWPMEYVEDDRELDAYARAERRRQRTRTGTSWMAV